MLFFWVDNEKFLLKFVMVLLVVFFINMFILINGLFVVLVILFLMVIFCWRDLFRRRFLELVIWFFFFVNEW